MDAAKRKQAGFTLIELTMVVLLLAILTVVGIPSFRLLYEKSEMSQATTSFSGALRYAQQRAVMERVPIRVVIDVKENNFWVPVEDKKERRHYTSRRRRRNSSRRSSSTKKRRVREKKEIRAKLPDGFIFEFVYNVAQDKEIRRREGEFYFYPNGSADEMFVTILRLAKSRDDEMRIFIKTSPATGVIRSMEGNSEQEGSDFYRGYYDDRSNLL